MFQRKGVGKSGPGAKKLPSTSSQPTLSRFFAPQTKVPSSNDEQPPGISSSRLSQEITVPFPSPKKPALSQKTRTALRSFEIENPRGENIHTSTILQTPEKKSQSFSQELVALPSVPCHRRKEPPKLTPLEQQVVDLKKQYPDALLALECGYKYRFFGEDAEIAAKALQLIAHTDHNFLTCSFPTHRLMVHVRRLVSQGYLVGVVNQTETTALKASSDSKNAPFKRELQSLYTRSTLIEDIEGSGGSETPQSPYFLCLDERSLSGTSVTCFLVAVRPTTGEMVFDEFGDKLTRTELETRLLRLSPSEVLIPEVSRNLSESTLKLVQFIQAYRGSLGDYVRLERKDTFNYSESLARLTEFFQSEPEALQKLINLSPGIVGCLGAASAYLERFKLTKALNGLKDLKPFTKSSSRLKIDGRTLCNLEVFQSSEGKEKGSLFWLLNKTRTEFGSRLLKRWLGEPLRDLPLLIQRQGAIQTIIGPQYLESLLTNLKCSLLKLPDLERLLTGVLHKRVNPGQFYSLCQASWTVLMAFQEAESIIRQLHVSSSAPDELFCHLVRSVVNGFADSEVFLAQLDEQAAKQDWKTSLFKNPSLYPNVTNRLREIASVETQIKAERPEICRILRIPAFDFVTVAGNEFLIEVPNDRLRVVPSAWMKVSGTKQCGRFRSPRVEELFKILCRHRENLEKECQEAFRQLLGQYGENYWQRKKAVDALAELDVLFALAEVAQQENYTKPELVHASVPHLLIEQGRHPVVSSLMAGKGAQYVPNDTDLQGDKEQFMILTGPNMGGKSCYLRQVALIVYLAHIGSFVPARRVSLSLCDAIWTRMGASDFIYSNRSTFLAEMQEAGAILREATPNSLAILDELGRGTSTHDGTAIAWAVCKHLVDIGCLTLFVTHYPDLIELERLNLKVVNYHMASLLDESSEEELEQLVFLYTVVRGPANKSFGLNVARLAGLPSSVLTTAKAAAQRLENCVTFKRWLRQLAVKQPEIP